MHPVVESVTARIRQRSQKSREQYLRLMDSLKSTSRHRAALSCGNLAHGFAAMDGVDKDAMKQALKPNIAIISAYNDLLSAHQPYQHYPTLLKNAIRKAGGVAQFAGGVPAMCDGVTQGQPGMDLSLLSRDVIAMATALTLSHNLFDGVLLLGVCDKIVPGLFIGALRFGHLPCVFVPAGPMPSGISNSEKARVRQHYAQGLATEADLLKVESASYHSPGTCTFYGTANSNQLIVETMGLQLPGSSFIPPNTPMRQAFTEKAGECIVRLAQEKIKPAGEMFDVKNLVNGMVSLLASGGSTNHTMHLVAMAQSAGYCINWTDFDELSAITPLLARIYPNGEGDINQFQQAGGIPVLLHYLLEAELLHEDVDTVAGHGLAHYCKKVQWANNQLSWHSAQLKSSDETLLTSVKYPFKTNGGVKLLSGNLGRAIIKTSALKTTYTAIQAPAMVFHNQQQLKLAFEQGLLNKDFIAVLRYQGPIACGMPELHQLTPILGTLQDKGCKVALVTDGRMSGASGKVPAAIHVTPEAINSGFLALIEQGDEICLDWEKGQLQLLVDEQILRTRRVSHPDTVELNNGFGRELFGALRHGFSGAEQGACSLFAHEESVNAL